MGWRRRGGEGTLRTRDGEERRGLTRDEAEIVVCGKLWV